MASPLNSLCAGRMLLLWLGVFLTSTLSAQIEIVGISRSGGPDQLGTIFSVLDDGSGYDLRSPFLNNREGSAPKGSLLEISLGTVIGTTSSGGLNGGGTFFKIESGDFTKIIDFDPNLHGNNCSSNLVSLGNGEYVLAMASGGPSGGGTLIRITDAGETEVLHEFDAATQGSNPRGNLVFDNASQTIYGSCSNGGPAGFGTAFSFNLSSEEFEVMHVFTGVNSGSFPQGGLILASDGLLYGTTQFGGEASQGTIFSIDPVSGDYSTIYDLNNITADGRYPSGKLLETESGLLMGTCSEGGSAGTGTIFSCTTSGAFTRMHSFSAASDGGFPKTGITAGSDGFYYGVTEFGAGNGFGSIYRISQTGVFTKLHDLNYTENGSNPVAPLIELTDGSFAGCAVSGGGNNFGTVFNYSDEGVAKIHDFSLPLEGAVPVGLLFSGSEYYGITSLGGEYNNGVFYTADLAGNREKLHDFQGQTEGQDPNGDLVENNGSFFGTAKFGGANSSGTAFAISSAGEFTLLHAFEGGNNGEFPYSGLCLHDDGFLYGTTISGGSFGDGILFRLDEEGNFEKLHDFFGFFEGGSPESRLVSHNGKLYGLTSEGGMSAAGTLIEYDPALSSLTVLHHFDFINHGATPRGEPLLHTDGKLYGTTTEGGANGDGTLFRFDFNTGIEVLHDFDENEDGAVVEGGLSEDIFGRIYGFCMEGGEFGNGTAFIHSEENGFVKVFDFSFTDSGLPAGKPLLFYPECLSDGDCVASEPCSVGICNFGVCEEAAINPSFDILEIGLCEDDLFDITLSMELEASPGGILLIEGQEFELSAEQLSYVFEIEGLSANGEEINLPYEFMETGCSGTSGVLGVAPEACPPVETTFIVDVGDLDVSPEGIHLGGNFQGWSPADLPMVEVEPGIWELTLEISGGNYEFNFFNGSSLFDGEYVVGDCAENGKRLLNISDESQTLEFCWGICGSNCSLSSWQNQPAESINIFPNPVNSGERLHITFSKNGERTYRIVDITGRVVREGRENSPSITVETQGFSSGYYSVLIENTGGAMHPAGSFIVQ